MIETYEMDDAEKFTSEMKETKATMQEEMKKQQISFDGIDWNDGYSVLRADFAKENKILHDSYRRFLTAAHNLECLKSTKKIAEENDSVDLVEFSGGFSGRDNVRVYVDHDNERVEIIQ